MTQKKIWWRAIAPVAVLSLALTACGSDDSDDDGDNGAAAEESLPEEEEDDLADPIEDEDEEEPEANAHEQFEGMEPVLEGMSVGDFAGPVEYEGAEFWARVDRVDTGSPADFDGDPFDPEQFGGLKPVHVDMTFVHVNGEELTSASPSGDTIVWTSDEDMAPPMITIGVTMPNGCEIGSGSADFSLGVEETLCESYPIAEDAEPEQVSWLLEDGTELVWAVD